MRTVRKCTIRIFLRINYFVCGFHYSILFFYFIFYYFIPIKNFLCLLDVYCILYLILYKRIYNDFHVCSEMTEK